jgi:hypothetical protein
MATLPFRGQRNQKVVVPCHVLQEACVADPDRKCFMGPRDTENLSTTGQHTFTASAETQKKKTNVQDPKFPGLPDPYL